MTVRDDVPAPNETAAGSPPSLLVVGGGKKGGKGLIGALDETDGFRVVAPREDPEDPAGLIAAALDADQVILVVRADRTAQASSADGLMLTMLNLPRLVLAVTAMDRVDFDQERYDGIVTRFIDSSAQLNNTEIVAVPVSDDGDNVRSRSSRTPWYAGPTLAEASARGRGDEAPNGAASEPPEADQFETRILWLSDKPMISGRQYRFRTGDTECLSTPERPKYRMEPASLQRLAARTLRRYEIGVANIALDGPVRFRPYTEDRVLGRFSLHDRRSGELVGIGLIHFALRRSTNVRLQSLSVTPDHRAALKGHQSCVLWFTGLSGAGKSTISNIVERSLNDQGCHTILLDGDNVRHGLNRDLGFTEADRAENIRRIAEVAKLMTDAGLIVLVSFISPFAAERKMARELVGDGRFLEIFVDAPLEVAEARDVKGLYKKARRGEIRNFTGIDSPYEQPESPELRLTTGSESAQDSADRVLELLEQRRFIG